MNIELTSKETYIIELILKNEIVSIKDKINASEKTPSPNELVYLMEVEELLQKINKCESESVALKQKEFFDKGGSFEGLYKRINKCK